MFANVIHLQFKWQFKKSEESDNTPQFGVFVFEKPGPKS